MNRKQWQFISGCVFIGMGWSAASAQVTNYNRLSLDEKVRLSTLIVMGTVTGQNEVAPFSTATRRAIVKVDTVLKGNAPEGEITIGYRSGDQWYDPNNKEWVRLQNEPIVVGKPCILFLRKAIQDAFAPVNWQMGTLPVDDGKVDDPTWPSDDVGLMYRYNVKDGTYKPKTNPWARRTQVPLSDALDQIRKAVKLVESQRDIGRTKINGALTTVVLDTGESGPRVLLRVPRRMECPSFDVSRVTAVLVPKPGDPVQTAGPCVLEEAPVSVDPIAQTEQLALLFPAQTKLGEFSHVELTIDGQKRKFCLDSSSTCKDDSLVLRCVVCKSADTRPYTHIPPTFTDRPCGFTPDPPPVPEQTDKEYPFQHHCNTCSFDF